MALVLPSTVEELNLLQNSFAIKATAIKDFDNIAVERKLKREVSLPNGLENWNISNFDSYLNFEDNDIVEAVGSANDRLVPEDTFERPRCESISSVTSSGDEKRLGYQNYGLKTISTVFMDSGSTCISSEETYPGCLNIFSNLDPEETYQNLDTFFQQVPELSVTNTDTLSSISSPTSSDYSFPSGVKRSADDTFSNDSFSLKKPREETTGEEGGHYHEVRRKNNIASKNCRKTRKEKQKEMEGRVTELETEREELASKVTLLEKLIKAHKNHLYSIFKKQ